MSGKFYTALFSIALTSSAFAQDDFDGFTFPSNDPVPSVDTAQPFRADARQPLDVTAEVTSLPSTNDSHVPAGKKLTSEMIAIHNSASQLHPQVAAPTYFTSMGPSRPSSLLSYMQCSPNACPNVWAGFAAQHQADVAAYCTFHAKSGCECGSGSCGGQAYDTACGVPAHRHHLHRNRYTQPATNDGCDTSACDQ